MQSCVVSRSFCFNYISKPLPKFLIFGETFYARFNFLHKITTFSSAITNFRNTWSTWDHQNESHLLTNRPKELQQLRPGTHGRNTDHRILPFYSAKGVRSVTLERGRVVLSLTPGVAKYIGVLQTLMFY